ncbi:phosphopantothenoylcysteine decarboxylase [Cylas formicarius]|uniref:phosphopantothenoylcysteine decarboxylase n=1 Tax=Cylas formicarius TaxID=197179 RepID=UPI0029584E40|nr:phosphopantothenoylcysteine decarboxylase [Cylas formicarius]
MVRILIGCTGSVATIKLPLLIGDLLKYNENITIRVIVTKHAKHFFNVKKIGQDVDIFNDEDEWLAWSNRGDPVLHIELGKWADLFLIAPLDANTLAKISNGICDNLLTSTIRAWEMTKPLIFCPAMNTKMYQHPLTLVQISLLKSWGYLEIPVIEKVLVCGDKGLGAMADVSTIVSFVINCCKNRALLV